ncbi:hypothetical protein VCHA29O37_230010 [Vibrio chagasii]|nr:hypothetical protein VCHA29O37_230010 [Vibrio chagasii]
MQLLFVKQRLTYKISIHIKEVYFYSQIPNPQLTLRKSCISTKFHYALLAWNTAI